MPSKFLIDSFEPKGLKAANKKLDEHILFVKVHKQVNDAYSKSIFKESLWQRLLSIFK
jgi:hypothetical protein